MSPFVVPPPCCRWATSATPFEWPREVEIVDHCAGVRGRVFLLLLVDLLHDDIEAAMAFDGVPIGSSDGWQENRRFWRGRCRALGCPGQENVLGAVEMVLVLLRR